MSDDAVTGPAPDPEGDRWIRLRRHFGASPERVFRAWADPEELARWLPERVEGGLAIGSRSTLVWPERRVWWEVVEAHPSRRFSIRRPWGSGDELTTTARVSIDPLGYGCRLELVDGPFSLDRPGGLDAWSEAIEHWTDALAQLRAHLDFSVDLRWHG